MVGPARLNARVRAKNTDGDKIILDNDPSTGMEMVLQRVDGRRVIENNTARGQRFVVKLPCVVECAYAAAIGQLNATHWVSSKW